VRDTDLLRDGDQEYQKECAEHVGFKTNEIAGQSNDAKHEQENLRKIDMDDNRHKRQNQHGAEGEKSDSL
jgi:hypothetical protein